jgi:rubrerythrin
MNTGGTAAPADAGCVLRTAPLPESLCATENVTQPSPLKSPVSVTDQLVGTRPNPPTCVTCAPVHQRDSSIAARVTPEKSLLPSPLNSPVPTIAQVTGSFLIPPKSGKQKLFGGFSLPLNLQDSSPTMREQMTISVLPIIRGEREDLGLLRDELQDEARDLVTEVDDYNSHIETLPRTSGGPITVDQDAEQKLIRLRDRADSMTQRFDAFISKVREWRCKRCEAFIDEILDVSADGQRKRCPVCNDMTRIAQVQASMGA